jgi:hypothetical protein
MNNNEFNLLYQLLSDLKTEIKWGNKLLEELILATKEKSREYIPIYPTFPTGTGVNPDIDLTPKVTWEIGDPPKKESGTSIKYPLENKKWEVK